jgi:hypothetical protein
MAKKRPQPLHKSRANVVKRTQVRIAQLIAEEQANVVPDEEANVVPDYDWHCFLNNFCFCIVLFLMNLLFLQSLYYKVHDFKLKQL